VVRQLLLHGPVQVLWCGGVREWDQVWRRVYLKKTGLYTPGAEGAFANRLALRLLLQTVLPCLPSAVTWTRGEREQTQRAIKRAGKGAL
jgi:hypothetical protein